MALGSLLCVNACYCEVRLVGECRSPGAHGQHMVVQPVSHCQDLQGAPANRQMMSARTVTFSKLDCQATLLLSFLFSESLQRLECP